MADIIQLRRDTATNWASANPTLAQGELGIETDTLKIKVGDGVTAWSSLTYFGLGSLGDTDDVTITAIATGEVLKWDGTAWVNNTLAEANIAAADHNHDGVYEPADATILKDADIGVNVQAYDADLDTWATKTAPTGDAVGTTDTQTLTNKTADDLTLTGSVTEEVYTLTGTTPQIDPGNGTVQYWKPSLGSSNTPTLSLNSGEHVTVMVYGSSGATITWPTLTWVNNGGTAPSLAENKFNTVVLFDITNGETPNPFGVLVGDGS